MRVSVISLVAFFILAIGLAVYFKATSRLSDPKYLTKIPNFNLVTLDGDTIDFTQSQFPEKLIFNFYSSSCSLCFTEVTEIISFSRKYKIEVLFVTTDSESEQKEFSDNLKTKILKNDDQVTFARMNIDDVNKLFGDASTPQTISFGKALTINEIRRGVVSGTTLYRSFEKSN